MEKFYPLNVNNFSHAEDKSLSLQVSSYLKNTQSVSSDRIPLIRSAADKKQLFVVKLTGEIKSNYRNPEYTIEELASSLAMSKRKLYRKCDVYLEMKPGLILREFRLNEAVKLIKEDEAVGNIALIVGFSTHSSFGRSFKFRFGCSPSMYLEVYT